MWSDPEVQRLVAEFVSATDDDGALRGAQTEEQRVYRKLVDELGHFKGTFDEARAHEIVKQVVYRLAPSGQLLASIYSSEPREASRTGGRTDRLLLQDGRRSTR